MEFEKMKVIWNSQNNEPMYAVNRDGLQAMLLRKSRAKSRALFWRELREISFGIGAAAMFLTFGGLLLSGEPHRLAEWFNIKRPPTQIEITALLVAALLWLHYALYQLIGRKRQEMRERQFDNSLRGDLERENSRVEHQILRTRNVFWWGLLPIWAGNFLFLYVTARLLHLPLWTVLAFASVLFGLAVFDLLWKQKPLEEQLLPWKRELESLREKLSA